MNHPIGQHESGFALKRVILIDSYTPGRITELPVSGNTALVGPNGRGKTTLLKLILAFYGSRTDQIIKPVSNQLPFAGYYLPRSTSYIVYEYLRDNDLRCAVFFSNALGDGVEIRFVKTGYDMNWFVHENRNDLVSNQNLAERLKLSGVMYSRKMGMDNYRAVIQGKKRYSSDPVQHRRDITDYAICPSSTTLLGIDRLVLGMFKRRTNFADLQQMIVEMVTESHGNIALGAERKKIETWPDAFDSYVRVMAQAPTMEEAHAAYLELMGAEHELRAIHGRVASFDSELFREETEHSEQLRIAKDAYETAQEHFRSARQVIADKIRGLESEIKEADGRVRDLEDQHKEYSKKNIEQLAAWSEREAEFTASCKSLRDRQAILVDQQSDIDEKYKQILNELELNHSNQKLRFANFITTEKDDLTAKTAMIQSQSRKDEDSARATAEERETDIRAKIDAATERLGRAKLAFASPQPDPELVAAVETQQATVNAARERYDLALEAERLAEDQSKNAHEAYIKLDSAVRSTEEDIRGAKGREEALLRQANPDEHSLLSFLRRESPHWTIDIAKVLREDLLDRTDLEPAMRAIQDSVYGLQLNLDVLTSPLVSNESALQLEIERVREEIKRLIERRGQQEVALIEGSSAREAARGAAAARQAECSISRKNLQSQEQMLGSAHATAQRSRDEAAAKAEVAVNQAQDEVSAARTSLADHLKLLKNEIDGIRDRQILRQDEVQRAHDQRLIQIENEQQDASFRHTEAVEATTAERLSQLSANGVDTATLTKLESEIQEVESKLKAINSSRTLVAQWRVWLESEWVKLPVHQQTQAAAAREKESNESAIAQLLRQWQTDDGVHKTAIARLQGKITDIAKTRESVAKLRARLEKYPANLDELPEYNPTWNLGSLLEQLNTQDRAKGRSEEVLQQKIKEVKQVFTAIRNSPADQFYDSQRQEMGADRAFSAREWVAPFKSWYMGEHEQYKRLLKIDARTIADAVADFHKRMDDFQTKIKSFNRQMQASIDQNQGFKSIGGLTIDIVSTIHELEYWGTVIKVAQSRLEWVREDSTELPPAEFSVALRELLSHWQLKEGIQAQLKGLVRIEGVVIENGNRRPFKKAEDLEEISSNGLSYIVIVLLFLAFINRIRGDAPVSIAWSLDEIGALDTANTLLLVEILKRNNVTLVTACPDPNPDALANFRNQRTIAKDRRIYEPAAHTYPTQLKTGIEQGVAHV